jgi:hypothetical protein
VAAAWLGPGHSLRHDTGFVTGGGRDRFGRGPTLQCLYAQTDAVVSLHCKCPELLEINFPSKNLTMNGRGFKIQKSLPEKHGSLKKKRKFLGGLVVRYFKVGWDGDHAVLYYSNDEDMSSGSKKVSLQRLNLYVVSVSLAWEYLEESLQFFCGR